MLFRAGDQLPVIPLFEVVGNDINVAPEQIAATCVNVGVTFGLIVKHSCLVEPQDATTVS